MKFIRLFLLLFLVTISLSPPNLSAEKVNSREELGYTKPKYYIDFVTVEERGADLVAFIHLTNGARFIFQIDIIAEQTIWDLVDELQPGKEVVFDVNLGGWGLRILLAEDAKFSYHIGMGKGSKDFFPKIVDIQKISLGWIAFSWQVTLSDGSTWRPSYIGSIWEGNELGKASELLKNHWRVGDTVIYSKRSSEFLINVEAPLDVFWYGDFIEGRKIQVKLYEGD